MERRDIERYRPKGHDYEGERCDDVTLFGNGREAELIVAGLKLLAAQIAIRDVMTKESSTAIDGGTRYPVTSRAQSRGVPLRREVDELINSISDQNFVDTGELISPNENNPKKPQTTSLPSPQRILF
jgi:hypothetical protein